MSVPVDYIERTRELYAPLPPYRWSDNRGLPVPWASVAKPLASCRVALGASGGVYVEGQQPFHFKDDTSLRMIPSNVDFARLRIAHFGYPIGDAASDPNCVFPLERLREMVTDRTIGELAPTALTFMGGIYSQRRVHEELIPPLLQQLQAEKVELFYLVPA